MTTKHTNPAIAHQQHIVDVNAAALAEMPHDDKGRRAAYAGLLRRERRILREMIRAEG